MDTVMMASVEASLISTLITQPMWVIKTRMVLNVHKNITEHQNFKEQVRELYRQHGLKGFLKGLQLSLILSSTGVVQMYLYEGAKTLY
jgi:solute carrier family 25 folate transporter 32